MQNWAHPEGHPHTEGTFTRTPVNVGDLCRNSGECQARSRESGAQGSSKFAKVRQTSPGFAKVRMKVHACFWYTLKPL